MPRITIRKGARWWVAELRSPQTRTIYGDGDGLAWAEVVELAKEIGAAQAATYGGLLLRMVRAAASYEEDL